MTCPRLSALLVPWYLLASLLALGVGVADGFRGQVQAQTNVEAARPSSASTPVTPAMPATAATPSEYDSLVLRALAAYDSARWDEARSLFEQAHALDPTARTLRTMGMAAFNQGDHLGALRNLEASLVEQRKPLTIEQRNHVLGLIDQASRMVGRYRVRLRPQDAQLQVDGQVDGGAPTMLGADELLLLPGRHELTVRAAGHRTLTRILDVRGNDRAALDLTLVADDESAAPQPDGATSHPNAIGAQSGAPNDRGLASHHGDGSSDGSASSTWGIVSLSVGGAALIASGVTFALALDDKSELDGACPGRTCPPEVEDTRARYQTLRVVSPVALSVGVLGVAVGTLLLLADGSATSETQQARRRAAPAQRAGLQPILSPSYAGVRGWL